MFLLRLFGGLSLDGTAGPLPAAALQRRRLALLALLGLAGERGMSRDAVQAYLWPDSSSERARHALDQLLYVTRRDLGRDTVRSGATDLRLDCGSVQVDLWSFGSAVRAQRWEEAVALYSGPLLDGVHLVEDVDFEHMLDRERERAAHDHRRALEALARAAVGVGDHSAGVHWRQALAAADPLSARVALELMRALAAAGEPVAAVRHARIYQQLVRETLGLEPDSAVDALAAQLTVVREHGAAGASPLAPPTSAGDHRDRGTGVPPATAVQPQASDISPPEDPDPVGAHPARRARGTWRARVRLAAVGLAGVIAAGLFARNPSRTEAARALPPDSAPAGARPSSRPALVAGSVGSAAAGTTDVQARELYLRARISWNTRTKSGLDNAVVLFRRATERDPAYAAAYGGLAESYALLGYFGFGPAGAMFPKAQAAAMRALALDSMSGPAYAALGQVFAARHEWHRAERAYERALVVAPADPTVHQWYALLLAYLGRPREAVVETAKASRLDPLSVQINNMYGAMLYDAGDTRGALRQFARTVNAEPDSGWVRKNPWVLSNYGCVAAAAGRHAQAVALIHRALVGAPAHPRLLLALAYAYAQVGETRRARAVFARADTTDPQYLMYHGLFHAMLGETDSAFALLERVREWPLPALVTLNSGPDYAALRADRRYQDIRQRLGMDPLPAADR